jgi:uncharacterized protein (TIGR03435 family)
MNLRICLLGVSGTLLLAQPAAPLAFEVASVKVANSSGGGVSGGCHGIDTVYSPSQQAEAPPLGRCVIRDGRLSHLIGIAYGVTMQNLKTGPDWIQFGALRFDVQAKAEDPAHTTEKQLLTMLQNLLVERFQLKFHYENKEVAGFALVTGKDATKLQASTSPEEKMEFFGPKGEAILKPGPSQPITIAARKCPISDLVNILTFMGGHGPGVDKTGLTGEYDFKLFFDDENGPGLAAALRDQLGLRIESEKVHISTLVVDSAEKPTSN